VNRYTPPTQPRLFFSTQRALPPLGWWWSFKTMSEAVEHAAGHVAGDS
jgi:hypothetical protein